MAQASRPRKSWVVLTGASFRARSEGIERSQSDRVMKLGWQCAGMTLELVCQLSGFGPLTFHILNA
jgi:hypothetical protein